MECNWASIFFLVITVCTITGNNARSNKQNYPNSNIEYQRSKNTIKDEQIDQLDKGIQLVHYWYNKQILHNLTLLQYRGYLMIIYNILGIEIGLSLKAFNEQKEKLLTQEDRLLDLERRLNLCKYLNNVKKLSYVRYT